MNDLVDAAGIPDALVIGAGCVDVGEDVGVVAGMVAEVGAIFLLEHGDVERHHGALPAVAVSSGEAVWRQGPTVVVGHYGVYALVHVEQAIRSEGFGDAFHDG